MRRQGMVPKLRKKRITVLVAAVLSCNFRFLSVSLVRGLSFNAPHGLSKTLFLLMIYPGPALRVVLSPLTFRYAL